MPPGERLSVNMRTAIALQEVFILAVVLALVATVWTGTVEMKVLALGLVVPIILLGLTFVYFCRRRKVWSYAGASILGVLGVALRVAVSTQPSLELGGGLPLGVTALYIVLGSLVALKSFESMLELRG